MKGFLLLILLIGFIIGCIALAEFLSSVISMALLSRLIYAGGAVGSILLGRRNKNV